MLKIRHNLTIVTRKDIKDPRDHTA